MGLTPGGRSGTFNPGWLPPVPPDLSSPQEGPPPGPLDPSHASLPPLFYPQPVCHCHLCIALAATQPALEKRIIKYAFFVSLTHAHVVFNVGGFASRRFNTNVLKVGASFCYCAYVLRILRYSGFLTNLLTNTIFLPDL